MNGGSDGRLPDVGNSKGDGGSMSEGRLPNGPAPVREGRSVPRRPSTNSGSSTNGRRLTSGLATVWAELSVCVHALNAAQLEAFAEAIVQARSVFVAGLGRSGAVASAFANRLMHAGLSAHRIGEVTTPAIGRGDLLVVISGSGRLLGADVAQAAGARVAAVTAAADSPLASVASTTIVVSAASSAQPMGSLFEQAAFLALEAAVLDLMAELGQDGERMRARHANIE